MLYATQRGSNLVGLGKRERRKAGKLLFRQTAYTVNYSSNGQKPCGVRKSPTVEGAGKKKKKRVS